MHTAVPQQPPLEVIKQDSIWIVEEFRRGARTGQTFATLDTQLNAVRFAKSKLDSDAHPCVVRWDTPRSVGDIYWNPLFARLVVQFDRLIEGWSVVPEGGTTAMAVEPSRDAAVKRAKKLQQAYDFKQLRVYDEDDQAYEERDHRFLRYDITRSGVRFDPDAVTERTESTADGSTADDSESAEALTGPASPGQLGASVPDVTKVTFTDTDGAVHRYSTPWGDGTNAEILSVSRKYATDEGVATAFANPFERWQANHDATHVASVYESGTDPTSWAAYRVGTHTLAEIGTELPPRSRITTLGDIAEAAAAVADPSAPVCGLVPEHVHLREHGGQRRATVADWGIRWSVRNAVGLPHEGDFLAPEQREGRLAATTAVYQFGAIAHWLLCGQRYVDSDPVSGTIGGVSSAVEPILECALSTDPADRYDSIRTCHKALSESL
jgi:hypothetical protein